MKAIRSVWLAACAYGLSSLAAPAGAQQLLATSGADGKSYSATAPAQSFLFNQAGIRFDSIRFSWLSPNNTPYAIGKVYLFSSPFTGQPNQLAASTQAIGSATASNTQYIFDSNLTLTGGTTYYVYSESSFNPGRNSNNYAGGTAYLSAGGDRYSRDTSFDYAFRITGDIASSATPEPAAWALMILGFGVIGGALRGQRRTNRHGRSRQTA